MSGIKGGMSAKLLAAASIAVLSASVTASAQSGAAGSSQNGTTGSAGTMNSQSGSSGSMNSQSGSMGSMNSQSSMGAMQGGGTASTADKMFAKKAIAGGLAEIQAGQLALTKSNSDDVKQFAQKMIDDHTKLNDQMMPIAQQIGVTAPTSPMPKDKKEMAKLQGLSGDEFDKAYIKDQVKDHKTDDQEFTTEASSGTSPAVKQAASQGEPIIKSHLQMAEQLAQAHNVQASMK